MSEIEAVIRVVLGAALVDGEIDARELARLKEVAGSVRAEETLKAVILDLQAAQAELTDLADVINWVRPAAEVLSQAAEQTRFIAVYAIDRMVADDEAIRARLVWRVDDNEAVLRERLEAHQRTIDEILQVRAPLLARARGDSRISP